MRNTFTPTAPVSPTAQDATGPSMALYYLPVRKSASGTIDNKVIIPNALTREVMAETEAGINVVSCASLEELFNQLDS